MLQSCERDGYSLRPFQIFRANSRNIFASRRPSRRLLFFAMRPAWIAMTDIETNKLIGMPFGRRPDPDVETLAALRRRYDAGELDAAGLAREIGLSPQTARLRLIEWGWRPARLRSKRGARQKTSRRKSVPGIAGQRQSGRPRQSIDTAPLLKRLLVIANHASRKLQKQIAAAAAKADVERLSRVLGGLVKIAAEIDRMLERIGSPDDHGADQSGSASGLPDVGSDMARIKSDLIERIIAATEPPGEIDATREL
jgi:hypothetical protein